ncbi:hypothetical protein GCM10023237_10670 [Streptomyces coeruleoprunus]
MHAILSRSADNPLGRRVACGQLPVGHGRTGRDCGAPARPWPPRPGPAVAGVPGPGRDCGARLDRDCGATPVRDQAAPPASTAAERSISPRSVAAGQATSPGSAAAERAASPDPRR